MDMILKFFFCIVLGTVLASAREVPAANVQSYRLEQPSSEIPMPAGILIGDWALAQWQNGLLVVYAPTEVTNESVMNLIGADRAGKLVFQHAVWLAGAAALQIIATAVSKEHLVAVGGYASSPSVGETDFIQEIRPDGSVLRVIKTGRFSAFSLAYDDRGDLWAAGCQAREQDQWPQHNILRRYRAGELQAEFLPYAEFLPRYEATTRRTAHPAMHGNGSRAFLLPLRGGVGLWSPATREWIEVGSDGAVAGRWHAPIPEPTAHQPVSEQASSQPPRMNLYGLAVTSSGEVVASILERMGGESKVRNALYRLDKASSSWQEIAAPGVHPVEVGILAGADGDNLVYRDHAGTGGWAVSALVQK